MGKLYNTSRYESFNCGYVSLVLNHQDNLVSYFELRMKVTIFRVIVVQRKLGMAHQNAILVNLKIPISFPILRLDIWALGHIPYTVLVLFNWCLFAC